MFTFFDLCSVYPKHTALISVILSWLLRQMLPSVVRPSVRLCVCHTRAPC